MNILYLALKYDYGDPARGYSFEHFNFYDTLVNVGHQVTYFDFASELQERGKVAMNMRLLDIVKSEKPDLLFCVLFRDELDIDTMKRISFGTDTVTFNWFCDDHWRFDNFSRYWAPAFNWVSTTAKSALPKYKAIGYTNVIKTQWACNHFLYGPVDCAKRYDVSFVGQPHGNRPEVIATLRKRGIDVKTWGHGWDTGRLTQEQMIQVFSESRVNLNLSNASTGGDGPFGWRRWVGRGPSLSSQIKGRNFEIPGCRAFLLTDLAEDLGTYYELGREVAVCERHHALADHIRGYLERDAEREAVASAGYARTVAEHTYEKRFHEIFRTMSLPGAPPTAAEHV